MGQEAEQTQSDEQLRRLTSAIQSAAAPGYPGAGKFAAEILEIVREVARDEAEKIRAREAGEELAEIKSEQS